MRWNGIKTARSCDVGRLAPLAAATTRPPSRVNSSRIRLDSLQSWLCSTKAVCVTAALRFATFIVPPWRCTPSPQGWASAFGAAVLRSFQPVAAQVLLVVGPAGAHLHPQREHHLRVQQTLQLEARFGTDALQVLAALADHDAFVRIALNDDGGGDVHAPLRGGFVAWSLARRSILFF